jgi:predicted nucleotidyltransferase component of viral defense system
MMDERSWESLLSSALSILDQVRETGVGAPELVLGGGTVLMMRMHHRLSRDIDLFLHDAQWLARLTPRLNDRIAEMVRDYSEQANSVKLILAEGDIDFVVAGSVTGAKPQETLAFSEHKIALEATEEILAKKLFFRAALLKPRDAFDLVAASMISPRTARIAIDASAPRRDAQLKRLRELSTLGTQPLSQDVAPLGDFAKIVPTMIDTALALIEQGDETKERSA